MNRTVIFGLSLVLACSPALAQTGAYSQSSSRSTSAQKPASPELRALINDLRSTADKAPRSVQNRNPEFFRQLDGLLDQYSGGGLEVVWEDSFVDGDYTTNPSWTVQSGTWTVEGGRLTSNAIPMGQQAASSQGSQSRTGAIVGVLGALGSATGRQIPGMTAQDAVIVMNRPLSNAFEIRLSLADLANTGTFEAGVFQQGQNMPGYRLVYVAGQSPSLALVRASDRGTGNVAQSTQRIGLGTEARELVWTRGEDGAMQVTIDGATVLQGQDKTFDGSWAGFAMVNRGGQFAIRSAQAKGAARS